MSLEYNKTRHGPCSYYVNHWICCTGLASPHQPHSGSAARINL